MKRYLVVATLGLALLGGCAKHVNAPLPAGAVDSIDASTNSILQAAHAFAARITAAVQSTDPNVHIDLTASQKSVLVNLNKALNIADGLEKSYHQNATSVTANALNAAVANVTAALTAAQSIIQAVK